MAPKRINVRDGSEKEQVMMLGSHDEYKETLLELGVAFLRDANDVEIRYFESLVDGGKYPLGPPLLPFQTAVQTLHQPPQFSDSALAALHEMAKNYVTRKRTIRLSDATQEAKASLMDMMSLPEKGASWQKKTQVCTTLMNLGGFMATMTPTRIDRRISIISETFFGFQKTTIWRMRHWQTFCIIVFELQPCCRFSIDRSKYNV
eukprot:scaffold15309_cov198-Amphora_coffeaeformis.AAC.7